MEGGGDPPTRLSASGRVPNRRRSRGLCWSAVAEELSAPSRAEPARVPGALGPPPTPPSSRCPQACGAEADARVAPLHPPIQGGCAKCSSAQATGERAAAGLARTQPSRLSERAARLSESECLQVQLTFATRASDLRFQTPEAKPEIVTGKKKLRVHSHHISSFDYYHCEKSQRGKGFAWNKVATAFSFSMFTFEDLTVLTC